MSQIPRKALAAALKPLLPKTWRIVPNSRNLDKLATTVVQLKQMKIEPAPAAPQAIHNITFVVTIASSHADYVKSEDELDDQVNELLHGLDQLVGLWWTTAEKVTYDSHLAYDVNLTIQTKKERTS